MGLNRVAVETYIRLHDVPGCPPLDLRGAGGHRVATGAIKFHVLLFGHELVPLSNA
jgi:hypothetical protein